ncbi:MAG TPA: hypothetical protein VFQ44_15015 [Streptosporangiaceae bacterium]|nr:hypothetical protein [Streptosporangiaceae bacterium]
MSDVSPLESMILQSNPVFWSAEDALDPNSPLAYRPVDVTLEHFLKRKIMQYNGHDITVRDVTDQLANVEGAGAPDTAPGRTVQPVWER